MPSRSDSNVGRFIARQASDFPSGETTGPVSVAWLSAVRLRGLSVPSTDAR